MTTDLQLPDFTTDTNTEYKTNIDEGVQNVERTAWSFAPHPASPTPNMTVDLNPGAIWDSGTLTEKAQQSTTTFTAPSVNPRIDRIVVDEVTGTFSIVAGSEAASPTPPAIPGGKFPVCQIRFETTSTSIGYVATATVAAITDERIPFIIAGGGGAFESELLHIRDEKASGTAGGTSTSATWNIRVLNTVKTNEISGASLSSNQITLPAGTYWIDSSAPAMRCAEHKLKLYNVTDAADEIIGTSEYSVGGSDGVTRSEVSERFTIAGTKAFELRHYTSTGVATFGLGERTNVGGVIEVYTDVKIWKVG